MSINRSHHVQERIRPGSRAGAVAVVRPHVAFALAPAVVLVLALAALALALLVPAPAHAHGDGSYPKTFNSDWTNNPNARLNARYDMVSLSSRATPAKFDSIKAINPGGIALVTPSWYAYYFAGPSGYPSTSGPWSATDPDFGYDRRYWDLLENNQFWAWGVDSTGARVHATAFWGMWLGNFSSKCPPNAQGKRLCDVFADFVIDDLIASKGGSAKVDGVFFDQLWQSPAWLNGAMGGCLPGGDCSQQTPGTETRAWFDLDADGIADSVDSLDVWWAEGISIIFARFRERMGDDFVIVGNGMNHFSDANGIFHERFPTIHGNLDPAPNPWNFRWQDAMLGRHGYLSQLPTRFRAPVRNILDTELAGGDRFNFPTSNTYRALFRFTLGSALLGDGYYGLNNGYFGCYYWLPEYDLRLGWPSGAATSRDLSGTTIWHRRFTNGEVWVNPTSYAVAAGDRQPRGGAVRRRDPADAGHDRPRDVAARRHRARGAAAEPLGRAAGDDVVRAGGGGARGARGRRPARPHRAQPVGRRGHGRAAGRLLGRARRPRCAGAVGRLLRAAHRTERAHGAAEARPHALARRGGGSWEGGVGATRRRLRACATPSCFVCSGRLSPLPSRLRRWLVPGMNPDALQARDDLSQDDLREAWPLLVLEDRLEAFRALPRTEAEDFFLKLSSRDQAELLVALPPAERRSWLRLLAPDDAADLIQEAPRRGARPRCSRCSTSRRGARSRRCSPTPRTTPAA